MSLLTLNFYYSQLSCTTASRISKKVPKKDSKRQKNDSNKKCSRKDGEKMKESERETIYLTWSRESGNMDIQIKVLFCC